MRLWLSVVVVLAGLGVVPARAEAAISFSKTSYSVGLSSGGWPQGVATGDFNGDGHADVAVAENTTPGKVSILLGNGAGALGTASNVSDGASSAADVSTGDFNSDGKLDLVAVNSDATASVLLGNGDGSFASPATYTTGANPTAVTVGDFNEDGSPDIATSDNGGGGVSVLLNKHDGTGTFNGRVGYTTPHAPMPIASVDTNADGHLDLLAGEPGSTSHVELLQGDGTGVFTATGEFALATGGGNLQGNMGVGDLNGDGRPDVAAPGWDGGTLSVLLNSGSGGASTFGSPTSKSDGYGSIAAAMADFNSDGKRDVAVSNFSGSSVAVLPGDGAGGFGELEGSTSSSNPHDLKVADFNEDGKPDIVSSGGGSNTADVLLNTTPTAVPSNSSPPTVPSGQQEGVQTSADHGSWSGSPTSYDYQWVRCDTDGTSNCGDITTNASSQNYTPVSADVGHTIKVRVTAHNAGGASSPATSGASGVVQAAAAPPFVSSQDAPVVAKRQAQVRAVIDPRSSATDWHFEYGIDTSYGQVSEGGLIAADSGPYTVTAIVASLQPGTVYHYRVIAHNALGTTTAEDQTFTTQPPSGTVGASTFFSFTLPNESVGPDPLRALSFTASTSATLVQNGKSDGGGNARWRFPPHQKHPDALLSTDPGSPEDLDLQHVSRVLSSLNQRSPTTVPLSIEIFGLPQSAQHGTPQGVSAYQLTALGVEPDTTLGSDSAQHVVPGTWRVHNLGSVVGPPPASTQAKGATYQHSSASLRVKCVTSEVTCSGTVTLYPAASVITARGGSAREAKRPLVLGRARFTVGGGHSKVLRIPLTHRGRESAQKTRHLRVLVALRMHTRLGINATVEHKISLSRRPRSRAKHA